MAREPLSGDTSGTTEVNTTGVLYGDAHRPAVRVEIHHHIAGDLPGGHDSGGGELEQGGVGVGKVGDFHGRAFRSKKAL